MSCLTATRAPQYGLTCYNKVDGYLYQGTIRKYLKRHLRHLGLPDIRVHDLRHTAATLMLANGINVKAVSEMLGHSNVSITLNIYAHVTIDMQQQAAQTMGNLLFR